MTAPMVNGAIFKNAWRLAPSTNDNPRRPSKQTKAKKTKDTSRKEGFDLKIIDCYLLGRTVQ